MKNIAVIHNHPIHGFNAPSDADIESMLKNKNQKYNIVLSENKIWMVENKYYKKNITNKKDVKSFIDCLNIRNDIKYTFDENKVNNLNNENSLENINKRIDIELSKIFEKHGMYSCIINV